MRSKGQARCCGLGWKQGAQGKINLARSMAHKAEGSFLKQHLDGTKKAICKGEVIHPMSSPSLLRKVQPSITGLPCFYTGYTLDFIFLV